MRTKQSKFRKLVQTSLCAIVAVIASHCDVWAAADKMLEDTDFLFLLGSNEFSFKYQGRGGSEELKSTDYVIRQAESGDGFACFMLATSYYNGVSVNKNDAEALRWMQKAAEYDVDWACCTYIVLAAIADGGGEYLDDALRYCRKYSANGYREANNNLGVCYAKGIGVERDPKRAANLFQGVAGVGMFEGVFNFGLCNLTGFGVVQNNEKAKELFAEAFRGENATEQAEALRSILSFLDSRGGRTVAEEETPVNAPRPKKQRKKQNGRKPANDSINYEFYRAASSGNTGRLEGLLAEYDIDPDAQVGSSEGTAALHVADADAVEFLIENGADIEARTDTGQTPLAWAALYNSDSGNASMRELARLGAEIDPRDNDGYTPLYRSIRLDMLKAAEQLLELGADVNVKDSNGRTPMHSAAQSGNIAAMELLKKHGANLEVADNTGETPLSVAHDADAMEWLLANTGKVDGNSGLSIDEWVKSKGFDFDGKDDRGRILEHYAAEEGRTDILEWLRKKNNGNSRLWSDDNRNSPFHNAVAAGQLEAMEWLKKHGADINETGYKGRGAMHLAAINADIPALEWLKKNGYARQQVYQVDHDRITPMHLAAEKGSVETMRWLKDFGADVNSETSSNLGRLTPFHMAGANDRAEVMQWLKDQGVDISAQNSGGFSPMHIAAMRGHTGAMEWLRSQGANLDTENPAALTPMLLAAANGQLEAMRYLHDQGVDINEQNSEGFTPTHLAAQNGRIDSMQWLKDNGANLNIINYFHQTPLHLAKAAEREQAVEWLEKQGAGDRKISPSLIISIDGRELTALATRKRDEKNQLEANENAFLDSVLGILDSLYSDVLVVSLKNKPKLLSETDLELTVKCEVNTNSYETFVKELDQVLAMYREPGAVKEVYLNPYSTSLLDKMTLLDDGGVETRFFNFGEEEGEKADEYDPAIKSYDWFLIVRDYDFSAGKAGIRHRYKIPQHRAAAINKHPIFGFHEMAGVSHKLILVMTFKDAQGDVIRSEDISFFLDRDLFGRRINQNTITITPAVMKWDEAESGLEVNPMRFTFAAVDMKRIKSISLSARAKR